MLLCRVLYKARNIFARLAWMHLAHVDVDISLCSCDSSSDFNSISGILSLSALFSPLDQLAERCHVSLRRAGHLIGSSHTFKGPGLSNLHSFPASHSLSSVSLLFSLINLPVLSTLRLTNGWWVSKRVSQLLSIYFAHFVWEIIMEFTWDLPLQD